MTEAKIDSKIDLSGSDRAVYAWEAWEKAKAAELAAKREVARARRVLDNILGDASSVMVGDEEVATYRNDGAFNVKKFTEQMPHIAADYMKWEAKQVFDVDRFQAENEPLFTAFRSRTLRVKGDNS